MLEAKRRQVVSQKRHLEFPSAPIFFSLSSLFSSSSFDFLIFYLGVFADSEDLDQPELTPAGAVVSEAEVDLGAEAVGAAVVADLVEAALRARGK